MKILTKQFNRTKITKNAIRFDVDGDAHTWAPYQKTFYLSLAAWQLWCEENGHDPEEYPSYLSLDVSAIDIEPAVGGKGPDETTTSMA